MSGTQRERRRHRNARRYYRRTGILPCGCCFRVDRRPFRDDVRCTRERRAMREASQ